MDMLKKIIIFVFIINFIAIIALAKELPIDGYSAMVNNRIITIGDVIANMQASHPEAANFFYDENTQKKLASAFEKSRDELIERFLILEDVKHRAITIPDAVIDNYVNNIIHERFDNNRLAFFEALAKEHLTIQEWREQVKEHIILMAAHRQEISELVVIPPAAIWQKYLSDLDKYRQPERVKLSVIIIDNNNADIAKEILTNLTPKDADFAKTAEAFVDKYSNNKIKYSQWDWINLKDLRQELFDQANELEVGAVSDIINIDNRFYIIKIDDKKLAEKISCEAVYKQLGKKVKQEEEDRLYKAWIARLKNKFFVKKF